MMLDKKELAEAYAERLVDDMDVNTLISCAIDYLSEDFKMFTLEELKAEIEDHGMHDDLLVAKRLQWGQLLPFRKGKVK